MYGYITVMQCLSSQLQHPTAVYGLLGGHSVPRSSSLYYSNVLLQKRQIQILQLVLIVYRARWIKVSQSTTMIVKLDQVNRVVEQAFELLLYLAAAVTLKQ